MADVPVRFAGLRGTLAAFAVDLFAGRVGSLTDAPMCSGGYDRWGVYDGSAWRLGPASDYAGNANVLSLLVNGAEVIDSTQNVKGTTLWSGGAIRINSLGDATFRAGTFTGALTVNSPLMRVVAASGQATVGIDSVAGAAAVNVAYTAGSARWLWGKSNDAESTGNAGSDWYLRAYSDAGVLIDTPLIVERAAGGAVTWNRSFMAVKGAANPGHTASMGAVQLSSTASHAADATQYLFNNAYYGNGDFRAIIAANGTTNVPCYLALGQDGTVIWKTELGVRAAGEALSTRETRVSWNKYGQISQWTSELVQSVQYVKTTDTTIGPSAAAKASLLNGGIAAGGFAAVSEPAGRWNVVGAQSDIHLKGTVSSVANQVLVFELYRNGASVATLTLPARTYGTRTPWRLEIGQDVRVAGASGTVRVDMRAYVTADNTTSQVSCYQMDSTLTGVNLTVAATWDVVCTIPNNAANSITCIKARKVG